MNDCLVERFIFLDKQTTRVGGRTTEIARMTRVFNQIEMFYLAQAICAKHSPFIQRDLNEARRTVMAEISESRKMLDVPTSGGSVVAPRRQQHSTWSTWQITPEFANDMSLTGLYVSKAASARLREAHRLQVMEVTRIVEEARNENK